MRILLASILLLAAAPTHGGLTLDAPKGWTRADADGIATFTKPGDVFAVVQVFPPEETGGSFDAWYANAWESLKGTYVNVAEHDGGGGKKRGRVTKAMTAVAREPVTKQDVYVLFFAVGKDSRAQGVLFLTGSFETYDATTDALEKSFASAVFDPSVGTLATTPLASGGWSKAAHVPSVIRRHEVQ